MKLAKWSHAHTLAAGIIAGLFINRHAYLLAIAAIGLFLAGILVGRFWAGIAGLSKKLAAEAAHRTAIQRAELRHKRAKARDLEAQARDKENIAREARRRADRARGITRGEVAELQAGAMMKGQL